MSHAATARELAGRVGRGAPQPALRREIEACRCPEEVRAGLYLLNGDWQRAHEVAQALDSRPGAHWHALVHRHEPDYGNSRYWLRRVGDSPVYPRLAAAARAAGHGDEVAPEGAWDPFRFTDCYARGRPGDWTRELDALERQALLEHCLERAGGAA